MDVSVWDETSEWASRMWSPWARDGFRGEEVKGSAATAGELGFVPVVVEPSSDLGRDESHATSDLVEGNAPFSDEAWMWRSVM